jgi:hypothetical protein
MTAVIRRRARTASVFAAALMATLAITSGCSKDEGPGVANVGTSSARPGQSNGAGSDDPVAYSKCMRANGLPNFPDPDANGAVTITGGPDDGLDPNSAQFKKALEACRSLQPLTGAAAPKTDRTAALQYAKCMRDAGVTKFPDPKANGGIEFDPSVVDANSAIYKAAAKKCESLKPGGAAANQQTAGTGSQGG